MHPLFKRRQRCGDDNAAAVEVHRDKGPGLIESIMVVCDEGTWAARCELCKPKGGCRESKGLTREEPLRFDLLVEGCVLVEAKAVEKILPIHKAQLLSS